MQREFTTLGIGNIGIGAEMRGVWQLLRYKEESDQWNHHYRGAFRPSFVGIQFISDVAKIRFHDNKRISSV